MQTPLVGKSISKANTAAGRPESAAGKRIAKSGRNGPTTAPQLRSPGLMRRMAVALGISRAPTTVGPESEAYHQARLEELRPRVRTQGAYTAEEAVQYLESLGSIHPDNFSAEADRKNFEIATRIVRSIIARPGFLTEAQIRRVIMAPDWTSHDKAYSAARYDLWDQQRNAAEAERQRILAAPPSDLHGFYVHAERASSLLSEATRTRARAYEDLHQFDATRGKREQAATAAVATLRSQLDAVPESAIGGKERRRLERVVAALESQDVDNLPYKLRDLRRVVPGNR